MLVEGRAQRIRMRHASLCAVLPTGADGLAGEDHSQGWRLRHPKDASAASALYCGLVRREDAGHGGRARPGLTAARSSAQRYDGCRLPADAGQADRRRRRARRAPAGKGATWPPPQGQTAALPFPAHGLVVVPVSITHLASMTSRLLACDRAKARCLACRRCALEAIEKVVTAPGHPGVSDSD
jgi:hypothetical protein